MRIPAISFLRGFLLALLSLAIWSIQAQELPPIQIFTAQEYAAENQNWGITQAADKTIYVANNKGLLEYKGAAWSLFESPNETILRSVIAVDNRVYTGCYMEFGYWQKDEFGLLKYSSLSSRLKTALIDDEQFWHIIKLEDWILFQSLNRIYSYNTETDSFKIIESETAIVKMFKVHNTIYYQSSGQGLYKIENGASTTVTEDSVVQNNSIVNIFEQKGGLYILTQNSGFYILNAEGISKWEIPANLLLDNISVYSSIKLKNGNFALGSISNGILCLDPSGRILYDINQERGLSNNTVLSLFEDLENNLWLGLDNGLNCINMKSPFRIYNDDNGVLGTVYASAIYLDKLYLGTNQGLFFKALDQQEDFQFISGTQGQVWSLQIIDELLFCGHNSGTFIIKDKIAKQVSSVQGTWNIKSIPNHKDLLLQGNYQGLNVLEKVSGQWRFRNRIKGFDMSSRFLEFYNDTTVFISHEYKGVFKMTLNSDFTEVLQLEKEGINKGLNSSLSKWNNEILYAYKAGVFKYDHKSLKFKKDDLLSQFFSSDNYITGKLIQDFKTNKLWGFSKTDLSYLTPGKLTSTPNIDRISLPNVLRKGVTSYENILHLQEEAYLIGTASGYMILDLNSIKDKPYKIHINSISSSALNSDNRPVNINEIAVFKSQENNIEFSFSVHEFDKYLEVDYQHQLKGIYDKWTDWTSSASILYKNLPYGDYSFNVRAKIGATEASNTTSFAFSIEKPWYLSNLLLTLYVLVILLFSFMMHTIYKRYYKKQREKFLDQTKRELALKKLENEQQLMKFHNEKLQQDINSKSRELAISTMSLIKKNEFLNNIKTELNNSKSEENLKAVIKIIDNNINNTDDWKFFQEAFNNADKDFLKKVKTQHPELTPNDLKLCAYLRLNLSSKEIAPLLNISSRSVEVKRYRLRKKMGLEHETSLTNYILDI